MLYKKAVFVMRYLAYFDKAKWHFMYYYYYNINNKEKLEKYLIQCSICTRKSLR